MKRRVIIIGSGIGGLACACLLAKRGYEVDVFEKNKTIGGKAEMLQFPHAFSEAFHLFFTYLNLPLEKYIDIKPLELNYGNGIFSNPYRFSYLYRNYDSPWDMYRPNIALAVLTELLFPKKDSAVYTVNGLVPSLISLAKKQGVLIRTNTPVAHIRISHEQVVGITTQQGRQYDADIVISDADYQYTETDLLAIQDRQYSPSFWSSRRYSPSAYVLRMQLNGPVDNIPPTSVIPTTKGTIIYINHQQKQLTAVMLLPLDVGYKGQQLSSIHREVMQSIEHAYGISNLKKDIARSQSLTGKDIEQLFTSYKGTIAGLSPMWFQSGLWQLNNDSRKVDYLYFVNSSDSLISPLLVYRRITDYQGEDSQR